MDDLFEVFSSDGASNLKRRHEDAEDSHTAAEPDAKKSRVLER